MKNLNLKNVVRQIALGLSVLSIASQASAISVDWSGTYRFEYTQVDKTSLDSPSLRKNYILNYLSLSPKIIAADGMNIVAKFDVLPNDQYPDSQAGQPFGRGPEKTTNTGSASSTEDSAVAGNRQGSSNLVVRQLYFNMLQEYGSFVIGRAPLDFGLGINYSAGNGLFDHWYNTRDMVGYKFIIGNFSLMPIIGKVSDFSVAQGQEAQDMIWDVAYNNPETESAIGIMHQTRSSSLESNDAPLGYGGAGGNRQGAWKTQKISIFLARGFEDLKFKIEAGFESGSTGIFTASPGNEEVELNGYGIAMELELPQPESRWHYNLRAGIASGDNPTTTNYEGFHFNRNYDVAFLMFNHPMGRIDAFRSGLQRGSNRLPGGCPTTPCPAYATDEALDDETISNAIYVSPKAVYNINDKWDWANSVTWAQLQTNPDLTGADVSKDVGFEWDTGLVYRPHERVTWVNELGLFFPGQAWKGNATQDFGTGFNFGFNSKAAISF